MKRSLFLVLWFFLAVSASAAEAVTAKSESEIRGQYHVVTAQTYEAADAIVIWDARAQEFEFPQPALRVYVLSEPLTPEQKASFIENFILETKDHPSSYLEEHVFSSLFLAASYDNAGKAERTFSAAPISFGSYMDIVSSDAGYQTMSSVRPYGYTRYDESWPTFKIEGERVEGAMVTVESKYANDDEHLPVRWDFRIKVPLTVLR